MTRFPAGRRVATAFAIAWIAAPVAVQPSTAAAEDPTFVGEVVVREVDVRFDRSVLPPLESLGRRGRDDFLYFEAGRPCPTLRFEPEGNPEEWRLLVWLDPELAGGDTLAAAARELAGRASSLAAAGAVEIFVASGASERRLGEFHGASAIAEALITAAAALPRGPAPVSPTTAARRIDRLVTTLAAAPVAGPSALLLPASGWAVDEPTLASAAAARRDEPAPSWAQALAGGGQALAAAGWVPIVLGLPTGGSAEVRPGPGPSVTLGPDGDTRASYPIFTIPGGAAPAGDRLDTALDLSLAPLADLARPGSGGLVGSGEHLAASLARVLRRARLVARAPEPRPGVAVRREVRWVGGDGRALPTPSLSSSGPPRQLAAARLRLHLAGIRESGQLSGLRIDRRVPLRVCLAGDIPGATVRFSAASAGSDDRPPLFGEPIVLRRDGGATCAEENLDAESAEGGVRLIEDLERGEWLLL